MTEKKIKVTIGDEPVDMLNGITLQSDNDMSRPNSLNSFSGEDEIDRMAV